MLQFIFGRPATGKTYTVLNKIKELTDAGKDAVFIVPEQFTFETERAVLKTVGDTAALNVSVLSFTRLFDELGKELGGISGKLLSEADKFIFMHRALKNTKSNLQLWTKYTDSINFARNMLDTINEFKINGISSIELKSVANSTSNKILQLKLLDFSLIYEQYDFLIGEKYIDPSDKLHKIYNQLDNSTFFRGKTVFFDSFKGFTGQQYKIINKIIKSAQDTFITLLYDPECSGEINIYSNIKTAVEKITRFALSNSIEIKKPIILKNNHYSAKGLKNLEYLMSGNDNVAPCEDDSVNIIKAESTVDEVEFVCRKIRNLVRTKGYRYRDFVIIARDLENYSLPIETCCNKNDIPCFFDQRTSLLSYPLAVASNAAINALNLSTESILRFHKTGLGTLSYQEISVLENYTYLWNIKDKIWLNNWDMDPRGFVTNENIKDKSKYEQQLSEINIIRKKAIDPIIKLKTSFEGDAENMVNSLLSLFEDCNITDKLKNMYNSFDALNDAYSLSFLKQGYAEFMKILNSLVVCFGKTVISKKDFTDALNLALSLSTIGTIPQMLDEVSFGTADRIRPSRPKVAFILGANQGVFPKTVENSGIFTAFERKALIEFDLNVRDNSIISSIEEDFLVYSNICCPSEKVYISYASKTLSGDPLEKSGFVSRILNSLKIREIQTPNYDLIPEFLPETENDVFAEYCRKLHLHPEQASTLRDSLIGTKSEKKVENINNVIFNSKDFLSKENAHLLYGKNIKMSATKIDTFNRCHFSYFCRYGLGVKKLQPADFDVLQRGTIVHFVLEKIISNHKNDFSTLSHESLDELTEKYIDMYLDSILGYRSIETGRTKFLISRISRSLKEVVYHISKEFAQSEFKPVACELKIGDADALPSLNFSFDGGEIHLNGSIDRVDMYNGYVRIIDYKTGSKAFKLPDILFGLNLQMLIYLYAVIKLKDINPEKAAGILYMPSKRDINNNGMKMNGLLQSNKEVIMAMDKNCNGEFVPKLSFNSDGSLSKKNNSYIEPSRFKDIFNYIDKLMYKTGNSIYNGDIKINPIDGRDSPACKYCDYKNVCGIENREIPRVADMSNSEVLEKIKEV